MTDIKEEVINIEGIVFGVKLNNDFSITLSFSGRRKKSSKRRTVVNITLSFYYLSHFKYQFKKIVGQAQARIDHSGFNEGRKTCLNATCQKKKNK